MLFRSVSQSRYLLRDRSIYRYIKRSRNKNIDRGQNKNITIDNREEKNNSLSLTQSNTTISSFKDNSQQESKEEKLEKKVIRKTAASPELVEGMHGSSLPLLSNQQNIVNAHHSYAENSTSRKSFQYDQQNKKQKQSNQQDVGASTTTSSENTHDSQEIKVPSNDDIVNVLKKIPSYNEAEIS